VGLLSCNVESQLRYTCDSSRSMHGLEDYKSGKKYSIKRERIQHTSGGFDMGFSGMLTDSLLYMHVSVLLCIYDVRF